MKKSLSISLIFLALLTSQSQSQTFKITLKVIDANDKPVAKAEASMFWEAQKGKMVGNREKPLLTDIDGKLEMTIPDWNENRPIAVFSEDRTLGGYAGASKKDDGKEVIAKLGPTAKVHGKLECKELGITPKWTNTTVIRKGFRAYHMQYISNGEGIFEFVLPVGEYELGSYGQDVKNAKKDITITVDKSELDLGNIDIPASEIAKLKGKPCPDWVIGDARGVKKDVKISDYKGKWVMLEFWGFW